MTLPQRIALVVKRGLAFLHPCVYGELGSSGIKPAIASDLEREVAMLMPQSDAKAIVAKFMDALPEVRRLVESDVAAAYEGDPAATSPMEVVMAYPGLYAVTIHRLAHELYKLGVPVIPRIMSELAHSKTGIDIPAIPAVIVNALNGSGVNAAAKSAQKPYSAKNWPTLSIFSCEMIFGTKYGPTASQRKCPMYQPRTAPQTDATALTAV